MVTVRCFSNVEMKVRKKFPTVGRPTATQSELKNMNSKQRNVIHDVLQSLQHCKKTVDACDPFLFISACIAPMQDLTSAVIPVFQT